MSVRVTQDAIEILDAGSPVARLNQAITEVLSTQAGGNARVTQTTTEILSTQAGGNARCTQVVVEILVTNS